MIEVDVRQHDPISNEEASTSSFWHLPDPLKSFLARAHHLCGDDSLLPGDRDAR
jgi:hypothetical protein